MKGRSLVSRPPKVKPPGWVVTSEAAAREYGTNRLYHTVPADDKPMRHKEARYNVHNHRRVCPYLWRHTHHTPRPELPHPSRRLLRLPADLHAAANATAGREAAVSKPQTITTRCTECGEFCHWGSVGDDGVPVCYDCWLIVVEKMLAVMAAVEICRFHAYTLDRPEVQP